MCTGDRAQVIKTLDGALLSPPTICVLGVSCSSLRDKGFQEVWIFDVNLEQCDNKFGPGGIFDRLPIPSSHSAIMGVEYILAAYVPGYRSVFTDVTSERGKYLMDELTSVDELSLKFVRMRMVTKRSRL